MISQYMQAATDRRESRQGATARITLAVATALLLLTSVLPGLASPARAQEAARQGLAEAGPINPENGYPFWYKDYTGAKLELCLNPKAATLPEDDPNAGAPVPGGGRCLTPFEMPDENAPMVFPGNFPGEAFWWTGEAFIEDPNDPDAINGQVVLAAESAFANENPKEGDQMSFGRVRVRINNGVPGATYRVTHPYGVDTVVAEDKDEDPATPNDGRVFVTEDIGCFPTGITACNFDKMLDGRVGPFLKWDTFGNGTDGDETTPADPNLMALDAQGNPDPSRPDAYFGDPDTPHEVVGSPKGTNYFKIEQIKDGAGRPLAEPALVGETRLFAITGKVAELKVAAEAVDAESRSETLFNDRDQKIKLIASEAGAEIFYTTDGSDPADETNAARALYDPSGAGIGLNSDPVAPAGVDTRIRAVAIKDGKVSEQLDKTYTVDLVAPNVVFSGLAAGKHEEPGRLTITTTQKAKVFYTTDGSDPTDPNNLDRESFVYDPAPEAQNAGDNVVNIDRSQTVKAAAVDLNFNEITQQDEEGSWSQTRSRSFVVANLEVGPINPQTGFPFWYADRNGVRLDQCLNPTAAPEAGGGHCATPMEMPADWQPGDGVRFPDRFPGEAFWWTGESSMETSDRGSADLIMALEAAFLNEEPRASDRMVFGRIRIRIDDLTIGETYKVTHPYGVDTYVAEDNGKGSGEINVTEDIGCMMPSGTEPCDFNEARFSRVGPFLTLRDRALEPATAPDGGRYLANPVTDQDLVQGSPVMAHVDPNDRNSEKVPANFFRVEGPGIRAVPDEDSTVDHNRGTAEKPYIQSDFFSITGKYSEFQAAASETGGLYNRPLEGIKLGASEFDAEIYYTLDGSDPRTSETRILYNDDPNDQVPDSEPINITAMNQTTTLKYVAYSNGQPEPTRVYTEVYELDDVSPTLTATPDPSQQAGPYKTAQYVTLASSEPGKVFYTTDGSDPADPANNARTLYGSEIRVENPTTIKAVAIDRAGNVSGVGSYLYDVQIPDTTLAVDATAPIERNGSATLRGNLSSTDATVSVAGKTLVVEQRPVGIEGWSPVTEVPNGEIQTAADGSYSLAVSPNVNTDYRVRFVGDDGLRSSASAVQRVGVRVAVSADLSTRNVVLGRKFTVSGEVRPAHTGSVTIVIERGNQREFRKVMNLRPNSTYSYSYAPRRTGTYTVSVTFAGDQDHLGNTVESQTIRVTARNR